MRVHKKIGTKDRLFEMFENVNKVKINEAFIQSDIKINYYEGPNHYFDELFKGNIPSAKEHAIEKLKSQNSYRSTEETLWATFSDTAGNESFQDRIKLKNGEISENFDSPIEKDKKYLDKTVGDQTSQVSKYDDGTRYPVEDKLKVKDPSLEKLKGDDAPIVEVQDMLNHANINLPDEIMEEIRSYFRNFVDGHQSEMGHSILPELKYDDNSGEIVANRFINEYPDWVEYSNDIKEFFNFLIQKGDDFGDMSLTEAEDDQDIANQDEPVNVGDVEPEDNDGGAEEKPAWDEDFGDDPEPEETEVEEPEMALDDIPAGDGEEAPELDNEIEDGGVEQMTNTMEEPHEDQIEGGLADDASPSDFCPVQIAKGIQIEMEHTDDPHKALEIAMDHLTEIPDYYDRLEAMEAEAKGEGMESDMGAPEDSLLDPSQHWVDDYAPQNVSMGDEIGEEVKKKSELEEDYPLVDPEAGEQEWEEKESYNRGEMDNEDISKELAQLRDSNPQALKQKLDELPEIIMVSHAGGGADGVGHRDLESLGLITVERRGFDGDPDTDTSEIHIKNTSGKPINVVDDMQGYKTMIRLENGEEY